MRTAFLKDAYPFCDEPKKLLVLKDDAWNGRSWAELIHWARDIVLPSTAPREGENAAYGVEDFKREWTRSTPKDWPNTSEKALNNAMDLFRNTMEKRRHQVCTKLRQLHVLAEDFYWLSRAPNGELFAHASTTRTLVIMGRGKVA